MTCPECRNEMEAGYLYVRGFGGALPYFTSSATISALTKRRWKTYSGSLLKEKSSQVLALRFSVALELGKNWIA